MTQQATRVTVDQVRHRVLALVLLIALSTTAAAKEEASAIRVAIGGTHELHLGWFVHMGQCDDKTIVRVDGGGLQVRLIGLRAGRTLCGFWRFKSRGLPPDHRLFEVTVFEPSPKQ